jgi:hypothetical protein
MGKSLKCGDNLMHCDRAGPCSYVPAIELRYSHVSMVTGVFHECLAEMVPVEERDEEHVASQGGLFGGECPLHDEFCERGDSVFVWRVSSLRRPCPYELIGAYNMSAASSQLLLTDTNYMFKLASNTTLFEPGCHPTRGHLRLTTAGLYIADDHFNLSKSDSMQYINSLLVSNADYKDHKLSMAIRKARLDACLQCVDILRVVTGLYRDKVRLFTRNAQNTAS